MKQLVNMSKTVKEFKIDNLLICISADDDAVLKTVYIDIDYDGPEGFCYLCEMVTVFDAKRYDPNNINITTMYVGNEKVLKIYDEKNNKVICYIPYSVIDFKLIEKE